MFDEIYGDHAFVTPAIVRWARERNQLSVDEAATKIGVKPDLWSHWEDGTALPTINQAQMLADRLHIPFGYLWLPEPPTEKLALPDLRTITNSTPKSLSPDLIDLVNDVVWKQQWYREIQEEESADPIPFIGRYSTESEIGQISDDLRDTMGLDSLHELSQIIDEFLRLYIRHAEDVGVLVLRSGVVEGNNQRKLNVKEFRGFAISDDSLSAYSG